MTPPGHTCDILGTPPGHPTGTGTSLGGGRGDRDTASPGGRTQGCWEGLREPVGSTFGCWCHLWVLVSPVGAAVTFGTPVSPMSLCARLEFSPSTTPWLHMAPVSPWGHSLSCCWHPWVSPVGAGDILWDHLWVSVSPLGPGVSVSLCPPVPVSVCPGVAVSVHPILVSSHPCVHLS